jgi:hypothetical protein
MATRPPDRRSGPAENRPAENVDQDAATKIVQLADIRGEGALMSDVIRRRTWSYRMAARCDTPPPVFGSREWLDLPDGDYRKIAGVVNAAECWATEGDDLPERLAEEVEQSRVAFKQTEDADYVARAQAHRREWHGLAGANEKFMRRRQAQLDGLARTPQPGDFNGRGRGA